MFQRIFAVVFMILATTVEVRAWDLYSNSGNASRGILHSHGYEPPVYVPPAPAPGSSGYTITRPGRAATYVTPNYATGGYTINQPGRPITNVNPW